MSGTRKPVARVVHRLSQQGVLDGLRRGFLVDDEVVNVLTLDDEGYQDVFALDPEKYYDDYDGDLAGVELPVGRELIPEVGPREPEIVAELKDCSVLVRRAPTLTIGYGSQVPLDRFHTVSELLEYERDRRAAVIARASKELEDLTVQWREWVTSEGTRVAGVVLKYLDTLQATAKYLQLYAELDEIRDLASSLSDALPFASTPDAVDDSLEAFMEVLGDSGGRAVALEAKIQEQSRRRQQLEEAKAWVMVSGSSRLKKALNAGVLVQAMGAYRDERLETERPGWYWLDRKKSPVKEIINPAEDDLDELLAERKSDPRVQLRYVNGPVLVAQFLGRDIFRPTSVPVQHGYSYDEEPF